MLRQQVEYLELNNGYLDEKTGNLHGFPVHALPTGEDDPVGKAAKAVTKHLIKAPPKEWFKSVKEDGAINVVDAKK